MNQLLTQLQDVWNKMDSTRRIVVVVVLVLFIASIIGISVWSSAPKYELLYSRVNEQDQGEIVAKLDELKIPYQITPGGGIEVPNAVSVRANLLSAGIPHGGVVGWEIFDKNSFSTTDFTNQINRQRAIAGELTRTLQQISGISDAKVILNLPDAGEYVFAQDKPDGTASVQLQLRGQGVLTEAQIGSIANLVAASTGIKSDNVTIIDNYANDLTAALRQKNGSKPGSTSASGLFEAKTKYENDLQNSLESMLAKVFGFNKSVVRVNADLNMDYQEIKSETFGDKNVPRSEQESTETSTSTGSGNSGAPGTDSNISTYKAGNTGTETSSSEKTSHTVNYEVSKVDEFRIPAPGKVNRLTVGVWVDGDLPETMKQKISNTLAAAVGISTDRGDVLTVETTKFTTPPSLPEDKGFKIDWAILAPAINPIIIGLFSLLWIYILMMIIFPAEHVEKAQPPINQFEAIVGDQARPEVSATIELSPEERLRIERLAVIEKIAREKPSEVAVLLKAWLAEE